MIALLGLLDASVLRSLQGSLIENRWIKFLGMLCLPFIWGLVCAVARGADDRSHTWSVLAGLACVRLWTQMLLTGATMLVPPALVILLTYGDQHKYASYINQSGQLLFTFAAQAAWVYCYFGACFIPLLIVNEPRMPMMEALRLSARGMQINGPFLVTKLIIIAFLVSTPLHFIPSYGIADSAGVVFMGVLSYVAYRDIFERRSQNLPQSSTATPAARHVPLPATGKPFPLPSRF